MSAKVFMPLFNYHAFIFFCKFFGSGQFAFLETLRFTEFHLFSHFKHCFTSAVADVNMNWLMIVAIEEKPEPSPFKNSWHVRDYFAGSNSPMCDRLKPMLPVPRRGRTFDTFLICFHRFALRSGVPQQIQSYCELLSFTGLPRRIGMSIIASADCGGPPSQFGFRISFGLPPPQGFGAASRISDVGFRGQARGCAKMTHNSSQK
jgi:hypothetical protein